MLSIHFEHLVSSSYCNSLSCNLRIKELFSPINIDFFNLHKICKILVYNMFIHKNIPFLVKIGSYLMD